MYETEPLHVLAKFAVYVAVPVTVTDQGFAVEEAPLGQLPEHDHEENAYPEFAVADSEILLSYE